MTRHKAIRVLLSVGIVILALSVAYVRISVLRRRPQQWRAA